MANNSTIDKKLRKALENHLNDLLEHQEDLFQKGHTFWHCSAEDESHKKPFYYYQINRSVNMSTCSTCYSLMANRKKIRSLQKQLGLELTPLYTNYTEEKVVQRLCVTNSNPMNPNYHQLRSNV